MAEIRVACSVPRWAMDQSHFIIEVGYISLNPYARELLKGTAIESQPIYFGNIGDVLGPIPDLDQNVAVPNCVGQTVTDAMTQVEAVGLRSQSFAADLLDGLPHLDWRVSTQTPVAGSMLARGRVVQLYSRPAGGAQTPPGIKTVLVHNQYQQHRALQIWNRDITAGSWKDEGAAEYDGTPVSVNLVDGHQHALFYADYALNSCRPDPNFPPDLCVYNGPDGPVRGDDNGTTLERFVS